MPVDGYHPLPPAHCIQAMPRIPLTIGQLVPSEPLTKARKAVTDIRQLPVTPQPDLHYPSLIDRPQPLVYTARDCGLPPYLF